VIFDEFAPRFDFIAHQSGKDVIGFDRILNPNLQENPCLRIHCGFPKLLRIHLAKAFITLDILALFAALHNVPKNFGERAKLSLLIAVFHRIRRHADTRQLDEESFDLFILSADQELAIDNSL
jgi:hypothetical protein